MTYTKNLLKQDQIKVLVLLLSYSMCGWSAVYEVALFQVYSGTLCSPS